ncbi:MAG: hypothetical protein ACREXY_26635, partial [Gammaproteobacteria bacterium]
HGMKQVLVCLLRACRRHDVDQRVIAEISSNGVRVLAGQGEPIMIAVSADGAPLQRIGGHRRTQP